MYLLLLSITIISLSLFPPAHGFQGEIIQARPSFLLSRQFQRQQQCKCIVERNNCCYYPLQQQQHSSSSSSSSVILYANKNNNKKQVEDFVIGVESQAQTASESWLVDATPFLSIDQSIAIQNCFEGRADIASFRVGGYYHNIDSNSDTDNDDESSQLQSQQQRRYRYVFTNPDLGYDYDTANKEYCSILRIDNVQINNCNPWPNILTSIGILLEDVGDIYIVGENDNIVYVAVNPTIVKTCIRLLPKELPGSGVTVTQILEIEEIKLIPNNGKVVEDMELKRLDRRAQK